MSRFDSLVQMSPGIADTGMRWSCADKPVPLPGQALDHATGYLTLPRRIERVLMSITFPAHAAFPF